MTDPDLFRFSDAQASIYPRVVEELTNGCKKTHWMWFIFPQVAGLGRTATAALQIGANRSTANVRFWHKADITVVLNHVRFRG